MFRLVRFQLPMKLFDEKRLQVLLLLDGGQLILQMMEIRIGIVRRCLHD